MILMLLLVFGMIFTGIIMYRFNPVFALAIFPALCLSLLFLLILFVKRGLDLKTNEILNEYKTYLQTHKLDREWLNKELINEQQLSHNKIGGKIHLRKKMIVEFCIQQLNVSTEESNQEILAQYLDAIKSSNSHELSANAKKVNEAFSYIYKYIDNTLTCKFNVYELEYFKVHVLEHISNTKVDKEIQKPISSINGIQKSDLGAFLHNLFVMCKYYNPQLRKIDFFEGCQKYFDKEVCDTAILSTNSTRIANGQKIFPIDMKKDNFFKDHLKEQQ